MTEREFYEYMSSLRATDVSVSALTLSPGPFDIAIDQDDTLACALILWLMDDLLNEEEATIDRALNILDLARWWLIYWSGMHLAEKMKNRDADDPD